MENRVVALSVLEDLIHWPLTPRDGTAPKNFSNFYLTGKHGDESDDTTSNSNNIDDDADSCFVAANNAVDEQNIEPRARRQARYRAVLRLPHLCHKLGGRWVATEVVPYLLRCSQEEDPQLSFAVGIALLGLLMPSAAARSADAKNSKRQQQLQQSTESSPASAVLPLPSSSSLSAAAAAPDFQSYLTLEAAQPVLESLCASRDVCTRHFIAQVVLPHIIFGTSVESDVTLAPTGGGWEGKYIPQRVWADEAALQDGDTNNDGNGGTGDGGGGGGDCCGGDNDEEDDYFYQQFLETDGMAASSAAANGIVSSSINSSCRGGSGSGSGDADGRLPKGRLLLPPPSSSSSSLASSGVAKTNTNSSSTAVFIPADPLHIKEDVAYLFDDECSSLVRGHHRRDPLLGHCGLREAGASSAASAAAATGTSGRRARAALMRRLRATGGGGGAASLLLRGVPTSLYGITYAAETGTATSTSRGGSGGGSGSGGGIFDRSSNSTATSTGGGVDYFFLNVSARMLVDDIANWMAAMAPLASTPSSSSLLSSSVSPAATLGYTLTLADYLSDDVPSSASGGGGGGAITTAAATSNGTKPDGSDATAQQQTTPLSRRAALRHRWLAGQRILAALLASPYPGAVAVAVETIAALQSAVSAVLAGTDEAALPFPTAVAAPLARVPPTATTTTTTTPAASEALAVVVVVAKPAAPLRTEAALQAYRYYATRRHVAFCLIAATTTSASLSSSSPTNDTTATSGSSSSSHRLQRGPSSSTPSSALELQVMARAALVALQGTLNQHLSRSSLLVAMNVTVDVAVSGGAGAVGVAAVISRHTTATTTTVQKQQQRWLQVGPGPRESRAVPLSDWDVCFSAAATDNDGGSGGRPMDVAHFFLAANNAHNHNSSSLSAAATPSTGVSAPSQQGAFMYAAENLSSLFRLHRVVRVALLRALPMCLDTSDLFAGTTSSTATRRPSDSEPSTLPSPSLAVVCRLLLEALAPASMLPALIAELSDDQSGGGGGGAFPVRSPSSRVSSFPTVGNNGNNNGGGGGEEETPASLDFSVAEAALAAVHRLMAEVAVALPTVIDRSYFPRVTPVSARGVGQADASSSSSLSLLQQQQLPPPTASAWRAADAALLRGTTAVLRRLFALLQVCTRLVSGYSSWKVRWLLARKLTGLASAFLFTVVRTAQSGLEAAERANALGAAAALARSAKMAATTRSIRAATGTATPVFVSSLVNAAAPWFAQLARLMSAAWGPATTSSGGGDCTFSSTSPRRGAAATTTSGGGGASSDQQLNGCLGQWLSDEEGEVRCVAATAATLIFDVVAQAATRLAAIEARSNTITTSSSTSTIATQASGGGGEDWFEQYREGLAAALVPLLSHLQPLMVSAMAACASAGQDRLPQARSAAVSALSILSRTLSALSVLQGALWTTRAFIHAFSSSSAQQQSSSPSSPPLADMSRDVWKATLSQATDAMLTLMTDNSSAVQLTLVAELADLLVTAPVAAAATDNNNGSDDAAAQVRHAALLACLDSLSRHEVWRFRERYAILLCEMCAKFLAPHGSHLALSHGTGGGGSNSNPANAAAAAAGGYGYGGAAGGGGEFSEAAGWAHTHPLFRLARDELLPRLVAVLFDKVKAVRDSALDAAVRLCIRISPAFGSSDNNSGGGGDGTATTAAPAAAATAGASDSANNTSPNSIHNGGGTSSSNRFVNDVLWPLIRDYPKAWETYLSRSALVRVSVRLRVDKESLLLPLLDRLAHDPVLNVRLVVAKTIHEVLSQSGAAAAAAAAAQSNGVGSPTGGPLSFSARSISGGGSGSSSSNGASSPRRMSRSLASMGLSRSAGQGSNNNDANDGNSTTATVGGLVPMMPPVAFTDEEKNGVVLELLRRLLEDQSADVRDKAARALKVCF